MFGHFSANRQIDIQIDGQMFGHFSANRQMDRKTDGQMFGHFSANRQMDRQTDGQKEFANSNIDDGCGISKLFRQNSISKQFLICYKTF